MTVRTVDLQTGIVTERELTPEEIAAIPPPPPPPPFIPTSVTMRQARRALFDAGLMDDVTNILASIPDETQRKQAQIDWEFAATVDRQSPLVGLLAVGLGLDDAALDALFTAAGAL